MTCQFYVLRERVPEAMELTHETDGMPAED
jgi:hypothetical protein